MINLQLHVIVQKPSISELHAPGTDKTDTIWSRVSYSNYHHWAAVKLKEGNLTLTPNFRLNTSNTLIEYYSFIFPLSSPHSFLSKVSYSLSPWLNHSITTLHQGQGDDSVVFTHYLYSKLV